MSKKSANPQNLGRILRLTQLSVLVALIIILAYCYIPVPFSTMTISLTVIPVAIAATVLGPSAGAICGAIFGLTSFWQALNGDPAGTILLSINPVMTFITCLIPRVLTGLLTGLISKAFSKKIKNTVFPCLICSVCCPVFNTLFFMGTLLLLFRNTEYFAYLEGAASTLIGFIVTYVGIIGSVALNAVCEITACFIIASAVSKALLTANKKLLKI